MIRLGFLYFFVFLFLSSCIDDDSFPNDYIFLNKEIASVEIGDNIQYLNGEVYVETNQNIPITTFVEVRTNCESYLSNQSNIVGSDYFITAIITQSLTNSCEGETQNVGREIGVSFPVAGTYHIKLWKGVNEETDENEYHDIKVNVE